MCRFKAILTSFVSAWTLIGLPGIEAHAAEAQTARAFVQRVYARYSQATADPKTLNDDAASLFAPELLSLIREDQRRANGEVGLLDHDPLCSCQDWDGLHVTAIRMHPLESLRAKATVDFKNGGKSVRVTLFLVRARGQWRISDVQEPDVASLRHYLQKALTQSTAKPD